MADTSYFIAEVFGVLSLCCVVFAYCSDIKTNLKSFFNSIRMSLKL